MAAVFRATRTMFPIVVAVGLTGVLTGTPAGAEAPWGTPTVLADRQAPISVSAVERTGRATAAWSTEGQVRLAEGGVTGRWSPRSAPPGASPAYGLTINHSPDGRHSMAVWADDLRTTGGETPTLWASYRRDGIWGPRFQVADPAPYSEFIPVFRRNGSGALILLRTAGMALGEPDRFESVRVDGTAVWPKQLAATSHNASYWDVAGQGRNFTAVLAFAGSPSDGAPASLQTVRWSLGLGWSPVETIDSAAVRFNEGPVDVDVSRSGDSDLLVWNGGGRARATIGADGSWRTTRDLGAPAAQLGRLSADGNRAIVLTSDRRQIFAHRYDGSWAAAQRLVSVPRQQGGVSTVGMVAGPSLTRATAVWLTEPQESKYSLWSANLSGGAGWGPVTRVTRGSVLSTPISLASAKDGRQAFVGYTRVSGTSEEVDDGTARQRLEVVAMRRR